MSQVLGGLATEHHLGTTERGNLVLREREEVIWRVVRVQSVRAVDEHLQVVAALPRCGQRRRLRFPIRTTCYSRASVAPWPCGGVQDRGQRRPDRFCRRLGTR